MMAARNLNAPTLRGLLQNVCAVPVELDRAVGGVCVDSRQLEAGDVFIAIPGHAADGAQFIEDAIARGAVAIIKAGVDAPRLDTVPQICVAQPRSVLATVAARFYANPSSALRIAAVTGTNGKTSVAHFIAHLMHEWRAPSGVIGTLGLGVFGELSEPVLTTPDAITLQRTLAQLRDGGVDVVAMEASSHALDQHRLHAIEVDVAVFTNLTRDHLDYHGNMTEYARAKQRLFASDGLRYAVVNTDDAHATAFIENSFASEGVIRYGLKDSAQLRAGNQFLLGTIESIDADGLVLAVTSPWGEGRIESALAGHFNAHNLLAALATGLAFGMPFERALDVLSNVKPVAGRMQRFGDGRGLLVVVDYAHTPDALSNALQALRIHCAGKLWCVFGCGGDRDAGKRELMGEVASRLADRLILTDDNPRTENGDAIVADIQRGISRAHRADLWIERDRGEAIRLALSRASVEDVVLVAGKGHEPYQDVGGRRLPFSDAGAVRAALAERAP